MASRRFGPFALERLLGQGGMGEVWLARRPGKDPVALKILQDQSLRAMFEDEAEVLARIQHPGVVRVHGLHRDRGRLALEMERLEGQTIHALQRRLFAEGQAFPVEAAVTIAARLADALAHLHARNIVHRDVAPQNVIIEPDGRVVLLDFGVARAEARKTRTAIGVVKGRPAFMAPEQAAGGVVGPKADVYALGVLLWELVAGRPLFSRETGIAEALRRPQPPPLRSARPEVPLRVSALVQAMLVEDPRRRIPSDDALSVLRDHAGDEADLLGLLHDRTGTAPLPAASGPARSEGDRRGDAVPARTGPTRIEAEPPGPSGPTTAPDGPVMSWSTSGSEASVDPPPIWVVPQALPSTPDPRSTRAFEKTVAARPDRPPAPALSAQLKDTRDQGAGAKATPPRPTARPGSAPAAPRPVAASGVLLWTNGLLLLVVVGLLWALWGP